MSFVDPRDPLWQAIATQVEDEGLALYDLERLSERRLRVAIDKRQQAESQDGVHTASISSVTSGDCTNVCKRLMVYLAVEAHSFGLIPEPEIEVSSPGLDRNLRLPQHFATAVGERVKLVPSGKAGEKAGPVTGLLERFDGERVQVLNEQTKQPIVIALRQIKKAKVEFKF